MIGLTSQLGVGHLFRPTPEARFALRAVRVIMSLVDNHHHGF